MSVVFHFKPQQKLFWLKKLVRSKNYRKKYKSFYALIQL